MSIYSILLSSSFQYTDNYTGSADSLLYSLEQTEHDNDLLYTSTNSIHIIFSRTTSVDCHDDGKALFLKPIITPDARTYI
jgi:hypothetical protein